MFVWIAHSSSELYGSDRSLIAMVRELVKSGGEVTVDLPTGGPLHDEILSAGAHVTTGVSFVMRRDLLQPLHLFSALISAIASARRVHRLLPPEAVVVGNTTACITPLLLNRFTRRPVVLMVREYFRSTAERLVMRALSARSSARIFNSAFIAAQFGALRSTDSVVYPGVDVERLLALPPKEQLGGRPLRVLSVGRLNGWKGQDTLIRACRILSDRGIPFEVRLVGGDPSEDGRYEEQLLQLRSALSLEEVVDFVGELHSPVDEYAWADVAVSVSTLPEPFGKVVVEAMAAGCVTIAGDDGGPSEVVHDGVNGILIPAGDADRLADALLALAADPARMAALATAARRRAGAFTEDSMARSVARSIVGSAPRDAG